MLMLDVQACEVELKCKMNLYNLKIHSSDLILQQKLSFCFYLRAAHKINVSCKLQSIWRPELISSSTNLDFTY